MNASRKKEEEAAAPWESLRKWTLSLGELHFPVNEGQVVRMTPMFAPVLCNFLCYWFKTRKLQLCRPNHWCVNSLHCLKSLELKMEHAHAHTQTHKYILRIECVPSWADSINWFIRTLHVSRSKNWNTVTCCATFFFLPTLHFHSFNNDQNTDEIISSIFR